MFYFIWGFEWGYIMLGNISQGTIGCTPNVRVPMVFIVFSRDY